ncbi:hypothetical protein C5167_015783 [Papaver somniferum]|uniref:Uncharacterized protein n=1 Tax=Papaver somniferum TaxID=3469 RepID=A0A4Y7J803_PAPSO|nr:hypothetical protein C5167_015783 [Papaver somniferum]
MVDLDFIRHGRIRKWAKMADVINRITPASTTELYLTLLLPFNPMTPTAFVPQGSVGWTVVELQASPPQVKEQSGKAKKP